MAQKISKVVGAYSRGKKRWNWQPLTRKRLKKTPSPVEQRKLSLFISYAREDRDIAGEVFAFLKASNTNPWLDRKKILAGQNWENEIDRAIGDSDAFLALLSTHSVNKRGYIQKELKKGLDAAENFPEGQIFLIPIRLDECGLPVRMKHLHYINWYEKDARDRILDSLDLCARNLGVLQPRRTTS